MQLAEHNPSKVYSKNKSVLSMNHSQLHDFSVGSEKGKPQHVGKPKGKKFSL